MLTFITKVYQNNKQQYHILLAILAVIASFEFCNLAIYFAINQFNIENIDLRIAFHTLPFLSIVIAVVLSVFVAKYFIENKTQEFSILLLTGRKTKDLFQYLLIQYGILSFIAFLLGILLGMGLILILNTILHYLSITIQFHYSFLQTVLVYFILLFFTIVFILAICSNQFVTLDKNLSQYLSHKKSMRKVPYKVYFSAMSQKRKLPVLSILMTLLVLYMTLFSIREILQPDISLLSLFRFYSFALAGSIVIISTTIPLIYDAFHHILVKHPILLNALACFNDFSAIMMTMVLLNACLVPSLLFLILLSGSNILLQVIIIPCFMMTIIMICLCFILRYSLYDQEVRSHMATYYSIGYNPQQLKMILFIKNILFVGFAIFIPLLLFIQLAYKAYIEHYLSMQVCLCLSLIYMISYMCVLIYIFIKEKNMLKEVTSHVKYINRGQ